jgi:DNA-directed RNA polymerase
MRKNIIESLKKRLTTEISDRSTLKYLKKLDVENYIDTVISVVYLYTRQKKKVNRNTIYLVEVVAAIGHAVRNKYKLKRNSAIAVKTGAFILYSFELLQMIQVVLGHGAKGHGTYIIQILDDDAICQLWNSIPPNEIEKLPPDKPYAPWLRTKHETGAFLIKTGNREVLDIVSLETHPILFDCINKSQAVGWKINQFIYNLHLWALRNKTDAFADIWELQNLEAKATKIREAKAIGMIAKKFLDKDFYHLYYYDFRGRKYPATAYLHEQGSDLARGLLLRADSKPIGEQGFFWLMIAIASNWAGDAGRDDGLKTDKIPLKERFDWAVDNEEILLSYAENPKVNQGWMKADKPWQFLAACNELMQLRIWQVNVDSLDNFEYESHLECYIDGL